MPAYLRFDESVNIDDVAHYGVLGMRWGVRNAETEARYARGRRLTSAQKTALKVAAGVATAAVLGGAVYAGARSGQLGSTAGIAAKALFAESTAMPNALGKNVRAIDRKMVASINADNDFTSKAGNQNCFHTSMAYILNSLYGGKVRAKPMLGIDELSGLQKNGRSPELWSTVFNGLKETSVPASGKTKLRDLTDAITPGSTGVIFMQGHFLNYEKTVSGKLTLIDAQRPSNQIREVTEDMLDKSITTDMHAVRIFDFTKASIADPDLLKYFVG